MTHPDRTIVLTHQRDVALRDYEQKRQECHDLRNDLTVTTGALQLLRLAHDSGEIDLGRYAEYVRSASVRGTGRTP